jgi:deazaflavin-dependent oxidoreductase (nitroreductase family)
MSQVSDFNRAIVDEFRANGGRVGGGFAGAPLLLLHHTGAKSGVERVNPMMYQQVGNDLAVFASKSGADTNPDWYHNLLAHPDVVVEVGEATVPVVARVATDEEREPIWEKQKRDYPGFEEYERKTTRRIPVVILRPSS